MRSSPITVVVAAVLLACSSAGDSRSDSAAVQGAQADSARLVASPAGFTEPEAVRYDPDQDIYFVSNWGTGDTDATDNNGFISRMSPDGVVDNLRFIAGGARGATLHSPRGMTIVGDTLWVVDVDAVRGFDRRTGARLAIIDFSKFKRGFLNDIAASPDAMYVTDTGTDHIYRIAGGVITVALHDSALGGPNGITWDRARNHFVVVPYMRGSTISSWNAGKPALTRIGTSNAALTEIGKKSGVKFDGVEVLSGDRILVASQADSSIHIFSGGTGRPIFKTGGAPADIAVDTKRNRVAVPFVARNLVEIWQLPAQ
jgi:sugar lactone lactonase YvrE